eukprot:SAG31_NODE_605_length_13628_cov_24.848030_13_plen_253_part_00
MISHVCINVTTDVGIGSGRHRAYFDDFSLRPLSGTGRGLTAGSFLLDVAPMGCICPGCHHPIPYTKPGASGPAQPVLHTEGGWAGFILDNTQNTESIQINALGRYKLPGNKYSHRLNIWDETEKVWLLPSAKNRGEIAEPLPVVDFKDCVTDALGFCYSAALASPVTLAPGKRFYIVSEEHNGGDAYAEMTDSATSTNFAVRDGRTFMSYRKPHHGVVSGRVRQLNGTTWVRSEAAGHDLDTSFGPVNFISL